MTVTNTKGKVKQEIYGRGSLKRYIENTSSISDQSGEALCTFREADYCSQENEKYEREWNSDLVKVGGTNRGEWHAANLECICTSSNVTK